MRRWKAIALTLVTGAALTGAAWAQPEGWSHQARQGNYERAERHDRDRRDRDDRRVDRDDRYRDRDFGRHYGWGRPRGDGDRDDYGYYPYYPWFGR